MIAELEKRSIGATLDMDMFSVNRRAFQDEFLAYLKSYLPLITAEGKALAASSSSITQTDLQKDITVLSQGADRLFDSGELAQVSQSASSSLNFKVTNVVGEWAKTSNLTDESKSNVQEAFVKALQDSGKIDGSDVERQFDLGLGEVKVAFDEDGNDSAMKGRDFFAKVSYWS